MGRQLLILRHAKSDWDTAAATDFQRPLAKRGRKDAPLMGKWLRKHGLKPDHVVSSPAARARETVLAVAEKLDIAAEDVRYDDRIYLADIGTLLDVLAACPSEAQRVLLVGHNPGLDDLLEYLCGGDLGRTAAGKLLTTAALAQVAMPEDWTGINPRAATLLGLVRPSELQDT